MECRIIATVVSDQMMRSGMVQCVCEKHGVLWPGFPSIQEQPMCPIGRIERLEEIVAKLQSKPPIDAAGGS